MIQIFKCGYREMFLNELFKFILGEKAVFQLAITYSKLTLETLEQGVKYVQS